MTEISSLIYIYIVVSLHPCTYTHTAVYRWASFLWTNEIFREWWLSFRKKRSVDTDFDCSEKWKKNYSFFKYERKITERFEIVRTNLKKQSFLTERTNFPKYFEKGKVFWNKLIKKASLFFWTNVYLLKDRSVRQRTK